MVKKPHQVRERFRQLRRAKGTHDEVGVAVGVTGTMIRYIEHSYANPSIKLMFRLSNYFSVPVTELFSDVEKEALEEAPFLKLM